MLNYCFKVLSAKGWIKVQNGGQSKNKFRYLYLSAPQGVVDKVVLTESFIKRKMAKHEAIKAEIAALIAKDGLLIAEPLRLSEKG